MKGANPQADCDSVSVGVGRDRAPLTTKEVGMHYCGLDVSLKSTHVYIEDAQGRRVKRTVVSTTPGGLTGALERHAARGLRIAIEAGNQSAWIYDLVRELGVAVHVVHPIKVK